MFARNIFSVQYEHKEGVNIKLDSANRADFIIDYIENNEFANVADLSDKLGVSEMTIRRDLQELSEKNMILRVHGGARSISSLKFEEPFSKRKFQNLKKKKAIATIANRLISDGDVIALDASSTAYELAKVLSIKPKKITLISNSIEIIRIFSEVEDIDLILIGGGVRTKSMSTVGSYALEMLENFIIDKVFLSSKSINLENGVTDSTIEEANVKKAMIKSGETTFFMLDDSKFNSASFCRVTNIEQIENIITNPLCKEDTMYKEKKLFVDKCVSKKINIITEGEV